MIAPASISAALGSASLPALSLGQRLADQFFQGLARGTDTAAISPLLSPAASVDNFDSLNLELDGQTSLEPRNIRRVSQTSQTPVQQHQADQAALDQVFAQADDAGDLLAADE
jgi:hypothetical protein